MTVGQMSAGQKNVRERFVENLTVELAKRYELALDDTLRSFIRDCRDTGLEIGFETDRQIADFAEACLITQNAIRTDCGFVGLMQKPLMRPETKAGEMLRRWVWPHPSFVADTASSGGD